MNTKPTFSNSPGLKSVFEKLRFWDGLVWTVDVTVELRLRFDISHIPQRNVTNNKFAICISFLY